MNPLNIYALSLIGIFVAMICRRAIEAIPPLLESMQTVFDKHLRIPYAIEPNRWIDGRTRFAILRQGMIVAISLCAVFLLAGETGSLVERSGYISVVQMAPCYLALHMSYAASVLCMRLPTFQALHIEFGVALVVVTTIHVIAGLTTSTRFVWTDARSRYGVIAASSLALLLGLCAVYLRRLSYEVFLRSHQLLAASTWFSLWYHIPNAKSTIRWYVLGVAIACGVMTAVQALQILIRHRFFYYGTPRVRVYSTSVSTSLRLYNPVSLEYKTGQYINLYMPGLGIRSVFESHPFIVVAVTDEAKGQTCQLMIKPARGWSRRLQERTARSDSSEQCSYLAFFSGPHGRPISVNEYGTVILVASQWGIMAQLPYLEYLIRSSHNGCTKVQRACLIWQLDHLDQGAPVRELLNHALREDSVRDRYIIKVVVFHRHGYLNPSQREMGHHRRVTFLEGDAYWKDLICSEVFGEHGALPGGASNSDGTSFVEDVPANLSPSLPQTLVTVSADRKTRSEVRKVVRDLTDFRVKLAELEYQSED